MRAKMLLIFALSLLSLHCKHALSLDEHDKMVFRLVAYTHLSEQDRQSLSNDWRKARVSSCSYVQESNVNLCVQNPDKRDFTYDFTFVTASPSIDLKANQALVTVLFNTIHDALLGPIIVVIDPEAKVVVGYVLRI